MTTAGFEFVSVILLWVLFVPLAFGVIICIRQLGEMYLVSAGARGVAGDGLDEGRHGPEIDITIGPTVTMPLRKALGAAGGLVLFASKDCRVCEHLVPGLIATPPASSLVIIYDSPPGALEGIHNNVTVGSAKVSDGAAKYRVRVTPFVFAIDSDFRVASRGLINHADQLEVHAAHLRQAPNAAPVHASASN